MENEHVISGLVRKRAEIAGALETAQQQVRQLIIDLDSVDATIRLFAPDIDLEEIRPKPLPPRHIAYKGEIGRAILNTLREARQPMSVREITRRVMEARSLNVADPRLTNTVQKRVGASLRHLRSCSRVQSSGSGRGGGLEWALA